MVVMQTSMSSKDLSGMTRVIARPHTREQRANIRWSGDAPYQVLVHHGEHAVPCGLKDISAGGAALTRDLELAVGHVAIVEINKYLRLPAVVVRVQPDRIAMQFTLPPTLAQVIEQAIEMGISPDHW
jgi:hypothetical protein